jgi:hypothetical protein
MNPTDPANADRSGYGLTGPGIKAFDLDAFAARTHHDQTDNFVAFLHYLDGRL